eukprot:353152-Chlamydomonas_euryale.AAC.10
MAMHQMLHEREAGFPQFKLGRYAGVADHPSLARRLQQSGSLEGHSCTLSMAAWSPDGSLLASGSDDAILKIWDLSRSCSQPVHSFDTGVLGCVHGREAKHVERCCSLV